MKCYRDSKSKFTNIHAIFVFQNIDTVANAVTALY